MRINRKKNGMDAAEDAAQDVIDELGYDPWAVDPGVNHGGLGGLPGIRGGQAGYQTHAQPGFGAPGGGGSPIPGGGGFGYQDGPGLTLGGALGTVSDGVSGLWGGIKDRAKGLTGWDEMTGPQKGHLTTQALGAAAGAYGHYQAGRQADKEREEARRLREEEEERRRERSRARAEGMEPFLGDAFNRIGMHRPNQGG